MARRAREIEAFIERTGASVLVQVIKAEGSVPREAGAFMLVAADELYGTIGGGQLEFLAIDHARRMLRGRAAGETLDIPLGPDIGQCCGGRVEIGLEPIDAQRAARLLQNVRAQDAAAPDVVIFGGGHVGRALARALAPLPFNTAVVDTRPEVLEGLPEAVEAHALALPEQAVRAAGPGTAFVVLTHDHALDFLVMREVLMRGDAGYAGMIGSKTKRAQFRRWFLGEGGHTEQLEQLVCPIGQQGARDKRPEIVAALVCAEIIVKIGQGDCEGATKSARVGARHEDG